MRLQKKTTKDCKSPTLDKDLTNLTLKPEQPYLAQSAGIELELGS